MHTHTYIRTYMHACIHTHIHLHLHLHFTFTFTCTFSFTFTFYIYIYIYIYIALHYITLNYIPSSSHTIFLCHTPSFTYNFVPRNFSYFSILQHFLCLSFLPRPATTFVAHYWKKLTCRVIRSFSLFLFFTSWFTYFLWIVEVGPQNSLLAFFFCMTPTRQRVQNHAFAFF